MFCDRMETAFALGVCSAVPLQQPDSEISSLRWCFPVKGKIKIPRPRLTYNPPPHPPTHCTSCLAHSMMTTVIKFLHFPEALPRCVQQTTTIIKWTHKAGLIIYVVFLAFSKGRYNCVCELFSPAVIEKTPRCLPLLSAPVRAQLRQRGVQHVCWLPYRRGQFLPLLI